MLGMKSRRPDRPIRPVRAHHTEAALLYPAAVRPNSNLCTMQ